jgi:hypothetical protein
MPYKVHTKDDNPYCVEKLNGEDVGCSDKEHIGAYLGKLNSVTENEIENDNEDKTNFEKGYNALIKFLNNKKVETSNVYKILTSGKKLSKDDKKELVKFAVTLSQTAIFLLPGGSIPILAYNLIKKKKETKQPEEIMENKLVGGRADNETVKDISKKFRVTVKYLQKQLKKGMKVESEHTDDKEKQKEIASDHLAEFPNYYEELEGMEKKLKDYWKDKLKNEENMNESKILIKKLLRENISKMTNMSPEVQIALQKELERLNLKPNDTYVIFDNQLNEGKLRDAAANIIDRTKTFTDATMKAVAFCSALAPQISTTTAVSAAAIGATTISCQKVKPAVYKFSYEKLTEPAEVPTQANYNGTIITNYQPQNSVGSYYIIIDNRDLESNGQLSEAKRLEMEKIETQKIKTRYKQYEDGIEIGETKLEFMGSQKGNGITTTNGEIPG